MIGLDTNVLVRYLAQDDPKQSQRATALIESLSNQRPGFITTVSLIELVWVMQGRYDASKTEVVNILETLCTTQELVIENAAATIQALGIYAHGKADFADCLIARSASLAGCEHTVTFDTKAAKTAGMKMI